VPGIAHQRISIDVLGRLLDANDQAAAHNRDHFDAHGVVTLNLMSSPGAGKTALLEATIDALKDEFRIAVIEGDLRPTMMRAASGRTGFRRCRSPPATPAISTRA
jgi:hydrogenase nickel incorporation protein HypB